MFKTQTLAGLLVLSVLPAIAGADGGDACTLPGIVIANDAAGDATLSPVTTANIPDPIAADDILQLAVAEPSTLQSRVVFTLKVAGLAQVPPQTRWVVAFTVTNSQGNDVIWYAAMTTADVDSQSEVTPVFEYGTAGTLSDQSPVPVGAYTKAGALDAASTFNADGTITLVLDPSKIGAKPGDTLFGIYAKVRRSTPNETMNVGLTADDTSNQLNDYTLVGNAACSSGGKSGSGVLVGALPWDLALVLGLLGAFKRRRSA